MSGRHSSHDDSTTSADPGASSSGGPVSGGRPGRHSHDATPAGGSSGGSPSPGPGPHSHGPDAHSHGSAESHSHGPESHSHGPESHSHGPDGLAVGVDAAHPHGVEAPHAHGSEGAHSHGHDAPHTHDPGLGPDSAGAVGAASDRAHDHDHDHGNGHDHGDHHHGEDGHSHEHGGGLWSRLSHLVTPHSHDTATKVDTAMETSREGLRALWISLAVLGATAVLKAIVVAFSGSVALLGDTLHNVADALTAVPLGIAFLLGRRMPTRRYTYGYGRAEDLAGIVIVVFIAASAIIAGY